MRIHSIKIENFRALEHLELKDIPDKGVVVIHGDNEQGKSSIMEAIGVVLKYKHTSKAAQIRAIQPVDRDVPISISVEMTLGNTRFNIFKQYLKKTTSELHILEPRRSNHSGDAADARLLELIESHLDESLFKTLFMKQGEVQEGISAVGIPSLTSALNNQNGHTNDDSEDTELMEAVEKEYSKYFTATGKNNARYEQFFKTVDGLRTDLDTASAQVAQLSSQVDRVTRLEADRDSANLKLPGAEKELASRRSELEHALKIKTEAEEVAAAFIRADEQFQSALSAQQRRIDLREKLKTAQSALAVASAEFEPTELAAKRETEQVQELTEALEEAREKENQAVIDVKNARRAVSGIQNHSRKLELDSVLEDLERIEQQLHELRTQQHAAKPVQQRDVDAVQKATTDVEIQRSVIQSREGSITLSASSPTEITVGEQAITLGEQEEHLGLDKELTFTIGEVSLVFNPGKTAAQSRTELESAEAELADLLDALDASDINSLRSRFKEQELRETEIASLTKEQRSVSGCSDISVLKAERDSLKIDEDLDETLSLEEAQAALTEAEANREHTNEVHKQANAALDSVRERPADRRLRVLNAQLEGLKSNVEVAQQDLGAAVEESSDEDIEALVSTRKNDLEVARTKKQESDELLAKSDPDMATRLCSAAETNFNSYKQVISDATAELLKLEGHIGVAAGAKERYSKIEAALRAAENRLASEERRAKAAKRLRNLMVNYRDESRKRYAAPFADKLSRLAAKVFGEHTDLDLDDELKIATRSIGPRTVNINNLSGGAKEQLAILTRFAIAELVAESSNHGAVPVFIDDALGSTDPERLTRISTLFSDAGKDSQVFVLTCVPDRYNYVEVAQKHSIETLKNANVML